MKNLILYFAALFIVSCSGSSDENSSAGSDSTTSVIQSPLEGDFQNDTIFTIDPTVENIVETPNGSSISLPANALVDANGNLVKDKVDLSFIQYHSMADIVASGIPMEYDSAGTEFTFQSAGMFTLDAEINNKPVFVKEGENLTVNLASDKDAAFNFYELNEQTGDWTYENSPKPVLSNERFDPSVRPIKPEKATKDAFVLDINFDLSSYSELTLFSGIVWEYTGKDDSLDPRKNGWISKSKWTDFELIPTNKNAYEYYLTMKNTKQSFTTQVKAALNGEDFETALSTFQTKKVEIAQKMDDLQKPFIRSVAIDGFGTYNYDYIHQMKEPEEILADFDFGSKNNDKEKSLVFVVYPDADVVVNYPHSMWSSFALDKKQNAKLLAILPDNSIAVCKNDLSQAYGKKKFTFKMDVLPEKIDAKNQLEKIIAEL